MNYKEVYEEIVKALEDKTPYNLIRIGDGENLAQSRTKMDYLCRRQFGFTPSKEDQEFISEIVKDAYIGANVIGIPTKYHIEHCGIHWARTYEYLIQVRPEVKDIKCTSIDVHSEMLEAGLLDKLLQDRDELIYISGRNLDEQFRKHFNIKDVKSFVVNAEQKFEKRKSMNHWPYQYKMVEQWIEDTDVKGKLCLTGAGILGKHYNRLLKEQGAISIDIGHIFDMWQGMVTRGKHRGTESDKYKL